MNCGGYDDNRGSLKCRTCKRSYCSKCASNVFSKRDLTKCSNCVRKYQGDTCKRECKDGICKRK